MYKFLALTYLALSVNGNDINTALNGVDKYLEKQPCYTISGLDKLKVRDVRWRLNIDIAMVDGQVKRKFDGRW